LLLAKLAVKARYKVSGVGGCAQFNFCCEILCIYNYLGCKKTLALQSINSKQN